MDLNTIKQVFATQVYVDPYASAATTHTASSTISGIGPLKVFMSREGGDNFHLFFQSIDAKKHAKKVAFLKRIASAIQRDKKTILTSDQKVEYNALPMPIKLICDLHIEHDKTARSCSIQ
jgi:hypothetical protein